MTPQPPRITLNWRAEQQPRDGGSALPGFFQLKGQYKITKMLIDKHKTFTVEL